MNFQLIIYINFLFFLIGIFGIFYSRDIISVFVSLHFIIISAVVNFLSFSKFLYQQLLWDKVFIILGVIIIYFIMFCLIYYIFLNRSPLDKEVFYKDFRIFKITRSDWFGEDKDNF
ncbi:MAG: hypothetical protein A2Z35_06225 [Actinobacteria bacterium RBG_19FT_COMBO_36_27]|nr:MAG: hypothetical protein A2Z35_06225 [Actinobacteria bacterium RBG_19FT_COMBO_36_27]